jgi:signal transduction histidine kinase
MRTRSRFVLLFALLGTAVMAIGLGAIYRAVAIDSSRRIPVEAERLLADAAPQILNEAIEPGPRLDKATQAILEARAILAQKRVMVNDPVIGLALQVAAILAVVLLAAALIFGLLARVFTRGIDELASGVARAGADRAWRFPSSGERELGRVRVAINELLDLTAEQERRLAEGARLAGWREVASFLAHQMKNPLAALSLAAENGRLALDTGRSGAGEGDGIPSGKSAGDSIARDSLEIVKAETGRLASLINRYRDLAPAGLDAYAGGSSLGLRFLLEGCAARARDFGAAVAVEGEEIQVWADAGLLEQAFWNLFSNSIEAAGELPVSIGVTIGVEGPEAVVTLADSNKGVDPAVVARLGIDRVSTKRGGTGLGLILVRRVLALQGGSLGLSQGREGGLVATVRLPMAGTTS